MSSLGGIIKSRRELLGYSQKKLGHICGLSDSEIMRIENGTREKPNWENLCRIAQALDFSPLEFLLSAGYISKSDIHPTTQLKGLEKLSDDDIEYLQLLIDFMISRKNLSGALEGGRSNAI